MVLIPEADFMMGADDELSRPDELPRHRVLLDPFWMDETEVTNAQFAPSSRLVRRAPRSGTYAANLWYRTLE